MASISLDAANWVPDCTAVATKGSAIGYVCNLGCETDTGGEGCLDFLISFHFDAVSSSN